MNVLTPQQTMNLKAWGKIKHFIPKELKPNPFLDIVIEVTSYQRIVSIVKKVA